MIESFKFTGVQFVRFATVGVINTVVDISIYFLLTRYLGFGMELIFVAKAISYIVATLNSFFLNRLWTFGKKEAFQWRELLLFYLTVGSGIFINVGVHFINVHVLSLNDMVSVLIAAVLTAIWGFLWSKYFVFR
jgi:putative flippase GtrA